jgi:hypothetical protein
MQVQWMQDPVAVPAPINQFVIQAGPDVQGDQRPDTFIVTFGHVTPPAMPQFENEEDARAFAMSNVALVAPVARLSFTPSRLRELHAVLTQVIGQLDQAEARE